ncbi:hypothetical protein [Mycobacterium sp. 852002-10029_SCH5224772]|uniref:hypothetical protein n=1 Tax=Mycobacterium sp. 852002-10029_SCH5224772 TaxID=1834083 RepID=UPI0007FD5371|nr:hypothetical protein [Mycobacterium sp. 852002-10029_SCH5224772]OBE98993.1 hypothetical protein A5775_07575 [Mycobacterium sp. 852002-10029_SCH5224772]
MGENDEDDATPIPRIYTLAEAAALLRVPRDWLRTRLANGTYAGLRRSNRWAMTEQQIMAAIESMTVPVREPETYPGGVTRRSWLMHQRGRRPGPPAGGEKPPPPEGPHALPSYFRKVYPETPEVIAGLPELSPTQLRLLERLRREGTVVSDGRERKTIEALVRRGLATYEAEYVPSEMSDYYIYRFTVRPTEQA